MRVNLRLNFGKIEELVNQSTDYVSCIADMQEALNKLLAVIESNKGLTADELKNKPVDMNTQINKLSTGTESMSNVLKDFCETMTGIIKPVNSDIDMFIATNDVKSKLKNLSNNIQDLTNVKNICELPNINTINYIDEDADKIENYEYAKSIILRMEEINDEYNTVTQRLVNTYIDQINIIYSKVENFENTDDEFENKGELIYENWLDLKWYETTTSKIIFGVIGVAACIVLVCFAGPIVGAATSAVGLSSAASAITPVVVSIAKGGLMSVVATTSIDVSVAWFTKKDIDSSVSNALCEGLITGIISTGFMEVVPVIVKSSSIDYGKLANIGDKVDDLLGEKGQILLQNKDKIIKGSAKVAGDMIGEKLASDYTRKYYNFYLSLGKAIGGQGVDYAKDKVLERLDVLIDSLDISGKFNDGVFMGYKGFLNILDGDASDVSFDDINNNGINNSVIQTTDSDFNDENH